MNELPVVDEHVRTIAASPEQVWVALLSTLRGLSLGDLPRPVPALWGLEHPKRHGAWLTDVAVGDTAAGFAVTASDRPRLLTLGGSHRFSRYELRFALDSTTPGPVEVRATTSAIFPGLHGRVYRGLVIDSGAHRVVVRRLLANVARRAEG